MYLTPQMNIFSVLLLLLALSQAFAQVDVVSDTPSSDLVPSNGECREDQCAPETTLTAPPLPEVPQPPLLAPSPSPVLSNILTACDFGDVPTHSQCTLLIVKPNTVRRGLVGRVLSRFEDKGFRIIASQLITPTEAQVTSHYSHLSTYSFFASLVQDMTHSPSFFAVIQGPAVVRQARVLAGPTNPALGAPGQLRFDLGQDITDTVVHTSDSPGAALREIKLWF